MGLRRGLLVWCILVVGDRVGGCPALEEVNAGPAKTSLVLLGDAVTVWSSGVLRGPGVEGLVRL